MTQDSRKEKFQSALSRKRHQAAVHTSKSLKQAFVASYRCCLQGDWNTAKTNFTTAMNICLTTIVLPLTGANQKD